MLVADVVREAIRRLFERPGRTLLTALGSVLGVATVVAIVGLSETASNQVSLRFDEILSTRVPVESASVEEPGLLIDANLTSILEVNGVTGVARMTELPGRLAAARSVRGRDIAIAPVAVSDGFEYVLDVDLIAGTWWDASILQATGAPVALIGETVTLELEIGPFDGPFEIWVDGAPVTVIGFVRGRGQDLAASRWVIVPEVTATSDLWGLSGTSSLLVRVRRGAGPGVAAVLPYVLDPEAPDRYVALAPPAPEVLRGNIEGDTRAAFLLAGAVSLLAGTVAISVASLTSVVERTEEFGLRRTLGARRASIAGLVLVETTVVGMVGGVVGCLVGLGLVLAASFASGWVPVFDPRVVPLAVAIGIAVGGLAGLVPGARAAAVEPVSALRRV